MWRMSPIFGKNDFKDGPHRFVGCKKVAEESCHVTGGFFRGKLGDFRVPSWELTNPIFKVLLKMIFLFPRWDILIPWWVGAIDGFLLKKNSLHVEFCSVTYTFGVRIHGHTIQFCVMCFLSQSFQLLKDILRSRKDGSQRPWWGVKLSQAAVLSSIGGQASGTWHCDGIAVIHLYIYIYCYVYSVLQ